ncbi:hypothetical protein BDR05DRAFT_1005835 [Suillus weaverae]|nr:hypothetical protein BDR05DRAFT_1005835 [Suillus weaverae]
MLMQFHFGLGVGHVYSHKAGVLEGHNSAQPPGAQTTAQMEDEHLEGEEYLEAHPGNGNDQDEESTHLGIEELNLFEQGRNSVYNYWGTTVASASGFDELEELFTEELNEPLFEEPALDGLDSSLAWRDSNSSGCAIWVKANTIKHILACKVKSPWGRIIILTKSLFIGSLWVGEYSNSFKILLEDIRHLITNCFLTTLHMVSKDYQQMLNEPVILNISTGETISVRWSVFHINMALIYANSKVGMRKVVKGAMMHTNFGDLVSLEKRIGDLVALFNSGHLSQVQEAISDVIDKQVFKELLWASLFYPVSDLADVRRDGRIADLFPEQILSRSNCFAQKPTGHLMTLIYQSMYNSMKDENPESVANFHGPNKMNIIIISALGTMACIEGSIEAIQEHLARFNPVSEPASGPPTYILALSVPTDFGGVLKPEDVDVNSPLEPEDTGILAETLIPPDSDDLWEGLDEPPTLELDTSISTTPTLDSANVLCTSPVPTSHLDNMSTPRHAKVVYVLKSMFRQTSFRQNLLKDINPMLVHRNN